jgi:HK97 family phage major capsid protein
MDLSTITRAVDDVSAAAKASGAKVDSELAAISTYMQKADARILDLEQKGLERRMTRNVDSTVNIAAQIAKDPKWEALRKRDVTQIRIEVPVDLKTVRKSLIGNSGMIGTSPDAGYPFFPQLLTATPQAFAKRRLVVLENLPSLTVNAGATSYPKLIGNSDSAAIQATEGTQKSETTLDFANVIANMPAVATYCNVTRQAIDDSPMLTSFIEIVLLYGVQKAFENLIVSGTGEINGLQNQGIPYVSTEQHGADQIGECIASLTALGFVPDLVIMNPFDFFRVLSARDKNERYQSTGFSAPAADSLWGVHTVATSALAQGNALVLDSSRVSVLDRMQASILIGYTGTQFIENSLSILSELRGNIAVFDPHAVAVLTIPSNSP